MSDPTEGWAIDEDSVPRTESAIESEEGFRGFYSWARSVAYVLCRDRVEAEDLVQDAMVRALQNRPVYADGGARKAWFRTVVFRLYLNRRRRAGREMRALLRWIVERPAPVEFPNETEALLEAVARLSPRQRACIVLRYLEGLKEEDVAASLGLRVGTVKAHLAQGRARLRRTLGRETYV